MDDCQGVIIPQPFLTACGLDVEVEIWVENDSIVILRKPRKTPSAGWAEAAKTLAESGDDGLVWPEFSNADDETLVW